MVRLVFAFVFSVLLAVSARAEVLLENLTWTELRDAIGAGSTTVIVPIGGTEQSGPLIALGKHNARVSFLSAKIAEAAGQTLVAPVIAYVPEGNIDPPTEHMRFPGTLSVSHDTFIQLLKQTGQSLHHAGFTHIIFIGDHGGYQKDLSIAADALNAQWHGKGRALALLHYYDIAQQGYVDALRAAGIKDSEIGSHAGLADTSLQLATVPGMVRAERLQESGTYGEKDGIYGGHPLRSSAALGQKGVDLIIAGTVTEIRNFVAAR
ncbi:creatininase family protein [Aestuariivirga litoralis]|uniref:creatininase family protein n=1 Tax=Aestuariivirga litoralis TaxID=2650924 RepID=UPI0018C62865|nr:creatininase family protein [Aestuariivirga litoralis]MBG1231545.1 creatininase family protein [Aestuariivirga litoralis]